MSTPATPPSPSPLPKAPDAVATPPPQAPARDGAPAGEGLDLEEDVAPNLGGEDQMQDA
jgi:hypothetical protein